MSKSCRKCNRPGEESEENCPECGGKMVYRPIRRSDLLNEYNQKMMKIGKQDLSKNIQKLEEIKDYENHPIDKIDILLERLETIKLLKPKQIHDHFISAGFYTQTSLRLYLILTCFEIIGQKNKFITFCDWINSQKVSKIAERDKIIEDYLNNDSFKKFPFSQKDYIELTKKLFKNYYENFGMKTAFLNFFNEYVAGEDKEKIIKNFWVIKNQNFIPNLKKTTEWNDLDNDKKFAKIIQAFEIAIRNLFTHQGKRAIDPYDIDRLDPNLRKIEKVLKDKKLLTVCKSRSNFDKQTEMQICFNSIYLGINKKNKVFAYSETKFDKFKLIDDFLDYSEGEYFPEDKPYKTNQKIFELLKLNCEVFQIRNDEEFGDTEYEKHRIYKDNNYIEYHIAIHENRIIVNIINKNITFNQLKSILLQYYDNQRLYGDEINFSKDETNYSLCYQNCSITEFLFELVEKGLYNYIIKNSNI